LEEIDLIFLIAGGAGRLGRELCRLLAAKGHMVKAFDLPNASWKAREDVGGIQLIQGDVTEPETVFKACQGANVIIHLAALLPPRSEADKESTMSVNVEGTRNLTRVLKNRKDVSLIFASSISTYGITAIEEPPIDEGHIQQEHNNYSESKIEAERLIRSSGIPYVILRFAPISVADLVELPEVIPYRTDQRVEFVYVADAAQTLFEAGKNPDALGKTFNITGGPSWQVTGTEYIEGVYDALGVEVDPVFSEEYTALDWYDTSRSRFLGYQRTTFNEFLERLMVFGEQLGLR